MRVEEDKAQRQDHGDAHYAPDIDAPAQDLLIHGQYPEKGRCEDTA